MPDEATTSSAPTLAVSDPEAEPTGAAAPDFADLRSRTREARPGSVVPVKGSLRQELPRPSFWRRLGFGGGKSLLPGATSDDRLLARLDEGWMPPVDGSGAAKLLVVSRALRLKRDHPELFTRYTPMTAAGDAAEHAVATVPFGGRADCRAAIDAAARAFPAWSRRTPYDRGTILQKAAAYFARETGRLP